MISLDTETTGVDFFHGARPFFVTTCSEDGTQQWWEWDVDPLTRVAGVLEEDVVEIQCLLLEPDELVLQNAKFDAASLATAGIADWPWSKAHDTLIAGHLLGSNLPHDLTSMAMQYLGIDIQPFEDRLHAACEDARKYCRAYLPEWIIARRGLACMPSAKGKCWKYDTWLPRALARELGLPDDHPWWTVLFEYGNADSAVTIPLWKAQRAEIERRGLWPIYEVTRRLPGILHAMESRGVTILADEMERLHDEYQTESLESRRLCEGIARGLGYELELPKTGNNNSLKHFLFGEKPNPVKRLPGKENNPVLPLPVLKWTDSSQPSLDKETLEEYKRVLPASSKALAFIRALSGGRKRDKSLEFIESYTNHGISSGNGVIRLYASINPTATATTRFSMQHPNLQQVSKQEAMCETCLGEGCDLCDGTGEGLHSVRRIFGPAPGREWWTADAKNIELRIPAYVSGEPDLIALFERPDDPPFYGSQHLLNFSIVYPDIWEKELRSVGLEKVGPYIKKKFASTWYQWDKNGDFAIQYQCGEETADRAFHRRGAFRALKSKFTLLEALNQRCVVQAEKHGYVETLPNKSLGMKVGYPLLCARGEWGRIKPTLPLNYMSQGTAGEWMINAMIRCHDQMEEWRRAGFDAFMALTIHDELLFDFPKHGDPTKERDDSRFRTSNRWRIRALQRLMEQGGEDIGVPTPVSIEYHPKNWSEGITL